MADEVSLKRLREKAITVRELVDQLRELPQDLRVQTEGCDCIGPCSGAEAVNDHFVGLYVLLKRKD